MRTNLSKINRKTNENKKEINRKERIRKKKRKEKETDNNIKKAINDTHDDGIYG